MEASLAACILAALLATGACLQCEVCEGQGTGCTGTMRPCPTGQDSCAIAVTVTTMAGVNSRSIHKGCVMSSHCSTGPVSMNFGQGMTTRTSVACCVGDACRTTTVAVPPANTEPNGRRCPACYSLSSEQCREETINCTGSETRCLDATGTITPGRNPVQMVMKGCVSQSICDQLQVGSGTVAGVSASLTTAKCTTDSGAAGGAPGPAGLLPALAGLLLLKLFS
ncbi:phospholipase A2 inhibitor and Ly6/PLAUR domain-containing protein-like [Mauremys mutica]|uniref:phospholipase A2 inhibitor and Ly6/PLAUR domain-containing protein-like n=1 Tax=Mauremys mutica TaxID=74926 RepID=UPI001D169073|nr:phospholipase A2 inhibitor and Ly6/PLAUR domain-containing protein-like isoform X1 [Mauremys mutica]XP_044847040.1 phospholipase A2 inhibitor and Ly6/PLAUR domain-containing protein-like isoform X2 [Mauremys mutica]XP_044847041.1 phospholipase A2 inhibitor and Ly6/PLAUR domain-containing protein-like isoform X2 [Mauremys mutica]XP_044847042.1 phospholipase A2 inhibitor and Ly6/PLAUR domain-containing protein-like isoform X2 [Mauremys mutica]XP_044847896.1 phospholipase A2 inhibitor and Ly6/P